MSSRELLFTFFLILMFAYQTRMNRTELYEIHVMFLKNVTFIIMLAGNEIISQCRFF